MTKRSYVPLPERLAATLACLLPQEQRDDLRRRKVTAKAVLALFHFDHVIFHAHGGAAKWWNLDPKLVDVHREKTAKIDVPAIAKGKRIRRANEEFARLMLAKSKGLQSVFVAGLVAGLDMQSPKRKWASRPFPKGRKIARRKAR